MFDVFTDGFRSIANKIRFSDDEKALDKALDELKKILLKNDVYHKATKELITQVQTQTKAKGIGKQSFMEALQDSLTKLLSTGGIKDLLFLQNHLQIS